MDLRGPMLCARAVLPHMMQRDEGIIINMTGGTNIPGRTSYCCSKVALNRLTVLLARELQAVGSSVVVFEMGPGLVKTRRTLHEAESPEGQRWNPNTARSFAEGNNRPPEECARAAVKLIARAGAGPLRQDLRNGRCAGRKGVNEKANRGHHVSSPNHFPFSPSGIARART